MKSIGVGFACVLGIGLLAAPSSQGGVSLLALLDFNETIRATDWDVVVATITEVSAHAPTNGNPPRVTLAVHKVLRGAPRPETIEGIWDPPWHGIDWVGAGAESFLARWKKQPMEAPRAGHRMILLGEGTPLRIGPTSRAVWTPVAEEDAAAAVRARVQDLKQWARDVEAERAKLARQRRAWRRRSTPETIARSAREADFVGIGRFTGGRTADFADQPKTIEISQVLKGVRREVHAGDDIYFADVQIPAVAPELAEWPTPELLVFLSDHGVRFDGSAPHYPLAGDGLVIADAEARQIVRDALAGQQTRPLPFCVFLSASYFLNEEARPNHQTVAHLTEVFMGAARGRCVLGTSSLIYNLSPDAGEAVRKHYPTARAAVFAWMSRRGELTLAGYRIRADRAETVFWNEPWPSTPADESVAARHALDRVLASR